MVTIPIVGTDAPGGPDKKREEHRSSLLGVFHCPRRGGGQSTVRMKLTPLFCIFTLRCTRSPRM